MVVVDSVDCITPMFRSFVVPSRGSNVPPVEVTYAATASRTALPSGESTPEADKEQTQLVLLGELVIEHKLLLYALSIEGYLQHAV